jgi:CheY-like chemotaxis protein
LKVLVLEDDSALRFALTQILEDAGHIAFAAASIPAACEILNQVAPDLLLLDLMIGPIDSIQVADLAGYRFPDAAIIYITGSNKFPNGELFQLSRNASWVLRKPVDFGELKAMIAHLDSASFAQPMAVAS